MRRLIQTLAAVAALAGPLAAGGAAVADGQHEHRDGGDRGDRGGGERRGGDRGGGDRGGGDRGRGEEHGDRGRGGDRGGPGWSYGPPPGAYSYGPPPGYGGPRRGGYMPPDYRGAPMQDYGRYRLRPPPRGYTWMRVGGSYVLMSTMTGQIFDVVPY
jgi:Ni/Co efflux regulator RcnB